MVVVAALYRPPPPPASDNSLRSTLIEPSFRPVACEASIDPARPPHTPTHGVWRYLGNGRFGVTFRVGNARAQRLPEADEAECHAASRGLRVAETLTSKS